MPTTRRQFSKVLSTGIGLAAAASSAQFLTTFPPARVDVPVLANRSIQISGSVTLPDPKESGIEHIVVVTMENRSFDHLLGWMPGADGKQAGLTYIDKSGAPQQTRLLAPDYTGCGHPDPDHSYDPDRVCYDGGKMDGFLKASTNDVYTIGYYGQNDIPFYAGLTTNYTTCDRYFASILGPTFPNRMFLWAAQTDRLDDSIGLTQLPTIFDKLAAAGVSHRYYFSNVPYLALWGLKYLFSSSLIDNFYAAAASGTLPAVSVVDPNFTVLDNGNGNDDHPHADIRNGDYFLSNIYRALSTSPKWKNTVLIVTFDEWGGFFEHVAPPRAVAPNNVDPDNNGGVLLGFRVPPVIASPFTKQAAGQNVNSTLFDHTSILKLIEWRFGLTPLTARDASNQIGNLATLMNFQSPDPRVPALPVVSPVTAAACFGGGIFSSGVSSGLPLSQAQMNPPTPTGSKLASMPAVKQWMQHPRFQSGRE